MTAADSFATGARSEAVASVTTAEIGKAGGDVSGSRGPISEVQGATNYATQLSEVPDLANYGPVLSSSAKPIELTESETEYVVTCVKHIFAEHIVFQVSSSSSSARL